MENVHFHHTIQRTRHRVEERKIWEKTHRRAEEENIDRIYNFLQQKIAKKKTWKMEKENCINFNIIHCGV